MSGFSSLNVGAQALFAAQRALDVTGQNVSNANTEGYSRQRVQQTARGASVVPAMFARSDASTGGVDILGTQRIRDGFLEARAHQEHATGAGLGALSGTYADIEATFGEPSRPACSPSSRRSGTPGPPWPTTRAAPGPRSLLLEQADTLADTVNGFSTQLTQQWSATRDQVATTVADVNSMASEVARLNAAVRSATLNGGQPNELADQRDLLVTRIAEATGAVATPGDGGVVNLTLGGRTLVNGDHSAQLQAVGPTSYPATAGTVAVELGRHRPAGDHRQRRALRPADRRQHHASRDDVGPGHRRGHTGCSRQHPAGAGFRPQRQRPAAPSSPVRRPPRCASS